MRRRWATRLGCLLLASAALVGLAGPASAETPAEAAAQASAESLLARVRALQRQAGAATTAYNLALAGLTGAVTTQVLADQNVTDRQRAASVAQSRIDQRAATLYMSGGPMAFYDTLLSAPDLGSATSGAELVGRVLGVDRATRSSLQAAVAPAEQRLAAARRRVGQAVVTERDVRAAAARLGALLAAQQRLLTAARGEVRRLAALAAERARLAAELAAQRQAAAAVTQARVGAAQVSAPGPAYLALYRAAAPTCPGLSWTVLAAIGQVESGHGRNLGPSSAGALGPMQFMPATFAAYGVDGNGDRRADIMNPADAIYSAARYLCANGAGRGPAGLAAALWRYNNADWYVQLVLRLSQRYAAQPSPAGW